MTRFWKVVGDGMVVQMTGDTLPEQIADIRAYVNTLDGAIPVKPYPASISYDESKPETIFAAAYAYVKKKTKSDPVYISEGVVMPTVPSPIEPRLAY